MVISDKFVFYVSEQGLGHIKERHQDINKPGSLFSSGVDLRRVIDLLLKKKPTEVDGAKIKWLGVDVGKNIGKMGVSVASLEDIGKMKTYTMPDGRNEKVKIHPGERNDTSEVSLVSMGLGKLDDGRVVLSMLTMFPGGMSVDGVEIPMDRGDFAKSGLYFPVPENSPLLKENKMKITESKLRSIIKSVIAGW